MSDDSPDLLNTSENESPHSLQDTKIVALDKSNQLRRAIEKGNVKEEKLEQYPLPSIEPGPVHGRQRVAIAGFALVICLIAPCIQYVPDNVRTGLLTIGGTIATALFKNFEKY